MKCVKWKSRENHLPYPQPWEYVKDTIFKNKKRPGVFVEIGATNGVDSSNCHFFESEWEWDGVCIEPNPSVFVNLKQNRPRCLNCAVGDENTTKTFCSVGGEGHSLSCVLDYASKSHLDRIDEVVKNTQGTKTYVDIPVRTFDSIMNEFNFDVIDYLSIDVEGAEFHIISQIDFDKVRVNVITAECNSYDEDKVKPFLETKGFSCVGRVCADNVFVRKDFNLEM